MPWVVYRIVTPELTGTPEAATFAAEEIRRMGPMSRAEWITLGVFAGVGLLWITSTWHRLDVTFVALLGLGVLLVTPLFYLGKIGWHPKVSMFQVENVLVESADEQPVLVEADGEFLGEGPVRAGILPNALTVFVPQT